MHYSVKMRAEKARRHISGAERIVEKESIQSALLSLAQRALEHPNGEPDLISVTVNRIAGAPQIIPALTVSEPEAGTPKQARMVLKRELNFLGVDPHKILELLHSLQDMRGAALVHVKTLKRMEPDPARGIRATCMDYMGNQGGAKNHLKEALCLASKVAQCPFIVGELCMSDDPDYTTGYFASKSHGYIRLAGIKEKGDPRGGRIFLFNGSKDNVTDCVRYLEETPVLVTMD